MAPSMKSRNQFAANPDMPPMKLSVRAAKGSIALNTITMSAPTSDTIAICQFFQIIAMTQAMAIRIPMIPNIEILPQIKESKKFFIEKCTPRKHL